MIFFNLIVKILFCMSQVKGFFDCAQQTLNERLAILKEVSHS